MSNIDPMPYVSEKETLEFFTEGLKQASARARELGLLQENQIWMDISKLLDEMQNSGVALARSKAMSRNDVLASLARREERVAAKVNGNRPGPKIVVN